MDLKVQKRLAAQIFGCSPDRVVFDNDRLDDIKQAITKRDLKLLIGDGAISKKAGNFTSKVHARKIALQKRKGRRSGEGKRKGKFTARFKPKQTWMNLIRVQREFLKLLLEKKLITREAYRELYLKSKGGYFRSKRHIKLYLEEHDELFADKNAVKKVADAENAAPKKTRKVLKQ
ncbi:MAG TPA: 50S ribosomal protein L19e [Allocoleopsis sp.]